ncbi:kinase-like protein [Xylariaceae sp. FL1019]|nr:kinase-like protein [Xylariaceae sp. FL1019]
MSSFSDLFTDVIGSGLALELQEEESLEPTNPFSSGHVERLLQDRAKDDARSGGGSANIGGSAHDAEIYVRQDYPIASLQSANLGCRILFQPAQIDGIAVSGAKPVTLFPPRSGSNSSLSGVRCLAVRESPEHTRCCLTKPFACHIYFDPYTDSVVVHNREKFPLRIKPSPEVPGIGDLTIHGYSSSVLAGGSWNFSTPSQSCVFQALVFPRTRVLELMALSVRQVAGFKRDLAEQDPVDEPSTDQSTGSMAIKHLECISDLVNGQVARFHSTDADDESDFTLFRMRRVGETKSAIVFKARHSGHPRQIIVVKAFKKSPDRDVIVRAQSWRNEYRVHLGIESENIAKLLGGDARIHALFLEHVDATDLCHSTWCDVRATKEFRGTDVHALCVVRDMARALQYLRRNKILHNDIKPANILFSGEKAVLIDFGLGTFDGANPISGGTPWYVGPEYLIKGERKGPSDMWALGIVALYVHCTIKLPDTGIDVPSWLIRDVGSASSADKQMEAWIQLIQRKLHLMKLNDEFGAIIASMLEMQPEIRITPDDLVKRCEGLKPGIITRNKC